VYGYWKLREGWHYDDMPKAGDPGPELLSRSSRWEGADDHPPLLATGAAALVGGDGMNVACKLMPISLGESHL
jgi:hypothetical protein